MKNKISVIVTIYNTPDEYLIKCLESITNQTLKEIEIILINDGSTEKNREICEEYQRKDSRIKLINQKNMGVSVARNIGIQNATTENITFVDSDDWIELDMCEKLVKYIEETKNKYDVIIFSCYIDYKNKKIKNNFYPKQGLLEKSDIEEIQLQNIEKGITKYYPKEVNISIPWAKVYNREFILNNKFKYITNMIRMADSVFNMEVFEKANNIYMLQEYFYHYQQNDFSVCRRYSEDTISYHEKYIKIVKEYIEKYNKNQKFIDTLNIKVITSIDGCMYNYFFNKYNTKKFIEIEKEFKELLNKELYQEAMQKVKEKYLSTYQKLVLRNAKRQNIKGLKRLAKIKEILKKIQGK